MNLSVKALLASLFLVLIFLVSAGLADEKLARETPDPNLVETLVTEWPETGHWKSALLHNRPGGTVEFFYPEGQGSKDWREMFSREEQVKAQAFVNMMSRAREIFLGTQKGSPNATWKILNRQKDENDNRIIIFRIDCPDFTSGEEAQIQLWKIIEGKTKVFTVQYTFRGKEMPEEKRLEISKAIDKAYVKVETTPPEKK